VDVSARPDKPTCPRFTCEAVSVAARINGERKRAGGDPIATNNNDGTDRGFPPAEERGGRGVAAAAVALLGLSYIFPRGKATLNF
jgi:hypothetical protein